MSELVTVDHGQFQITSNSRTADEMSASLSAADEHFSVPGAKKADADPGDETDDLGGEAAKDTKPTSELSEAAKTLAKGKRDKVQERIDKAVAAQRNAERERDAEKQAREGLSQRLAQLEARLNQPSNASAQTQATIQDATPQEKASAAAALPALDKYNTIEEWQADVAAMIRKQALDDFRAEQAREREQAELTSKVKTAAQRIADFKNEHADYEEVTRIELPQVPASAALTEYLRDSEMGPQLAYELGKNREELNRILSQPNQVTLVAALARLEGKLEARSSAAASGSAPAPKLVVSNAKPPIKPLGASPVTADADPDDVPFSAAYVAEMNKRDRLARRTR